MLPSNPAANENPPGARIESLWRIALWNKKEADAFASASYGAGDEARTRYLHLGKVALYRMSYTRNGHDVL